MGVDLARRLFACKGWRWLRCCPWVGMLDNYERCGVMRSDRAPDPQYKALPDTSSPALPGLVLHLVREAWGASDDLDTARLEALCAALEAADGA